MDGRRRALIIASDEYDHPGLSRLRGPAADAEALANVLGDSDIGGFHVEVVHNAPAHVVQGRVEDLFADSQSDDVVLLHFSGHGLKSDSGELFFAARNTRPDRLGSTAVPADFVQRCMRGSRARSIVLFLDCCYGGAFGEGVAVRAAGSANVLQSFPAGRLGGGRGRAVITASSAMEYAFEGDSLADEHQQQPSVFTAALVEGLASGEADRDEDGLVSLNELYDYVYDRVRERNPKQTPGRDVELQGEMYLARSRRRRLRPLPIPADVAAALTSDNMFTRLGAVTELRSRMTSPDLGAALGAYQALVEVSRSDIRYVQEAATEALGGATALPEPAELHFGTVADADLPVVRTIHLTGPPLALGMKVSECAEWVTVTVEPPEVQVRIDTTEWGYLAGAVMLSGPTCQIVIPVTAEVTAASTSPSAAPEVDEPPDPVVPTARAPATSVETVSASPVIAEAADAPAASSPEPAPATGTPSTIAPATRSYWKLSGSTALVSGVLLLLCVVLPQQWNETTLQNDAIKATYLLYLGPVVIFAGVMALLARWRTQGLGAVIGVSAIGVVVLLDMVNTLDYLGSSGLGVGFWAGFLAPAVLLVAGAFALADIRRESGAGFASPSRSDPAAWCVLVLAVAGALPVVWSAVDLFPFSDKTRPGLHGLCVALLAVLVPLVAVLARPVMLGRWVLIGWCLACVAPVLALWLRWARDDASTHAMWFTLLTLAAMIGLAPLTHRDHTQGNRHLN